MYGQFKLDKEKAVLHNHTFGYSHGYALLVTICLARWQRYIGPGYQSEMRQACILIGVITLIYVSIINWNDSFYQQLQ